MKILLGKFLFRLTRILLSFFKINIAIVGSSINYPELSKKEIEFCEKIFRSSTTLTSLDSLKVLAIACKYVEGKKIPGAFVEAGVWRGGSAIVARKFLEKSRSFFLYDTFEGMTEPGENDFRIGANTNKSTVEKWNSLKKDSGSAWVASSLQEVESNFRNFEVFDESILFIKGDVRKTLQLKENVPHTIALLRLDTDFYDSTLIELEILWPLLANGGILILDDYGHWDGARKAVDEYFERHNIQPLMIPIAGGGGRILLKGN